MKSHKLELVIVTALCVFCSACLNFTSEKNEKTSQIVITFNMAIPDNDEKNDAISKDIYKYLDFTHVYCGLNAIGFQENIKELQSISSGTDFDQMIRMYTAAARLCHDSKIKPEKYSKSDFSNNSKAQETSFSPKLDVNVATQSGTIVVPFTRKTSIASSKNLIEEIEYSPQLTISSDGLRNLQAMEDMAYSEVTKKMAGGGFSKYRSKDIEGTWLWKMGDEGTITFVLKHDRTMTGTLNQNGYDPMYMIGNYCEGEWDFSKSQLRIIMQRAGNKLAKIILKPHVQTWVDSKIKYLNNDEIVIENGDKLLRIKTE